MPRYSTSRSANSRKKRRSSHSNRSNTNLRGGGVVMPAEYYGQDSGAYVDQCGPTPFSTAYGEAVPRSFGTLNTSLGPSFAAPQLAPGGMSAGTMSSGIQTGGGRRHRLRKRRTSRTLQIRKKTATRRNNNRSGRRRTSRSNTRRNMRGGGVVMPAEYYGQDSGAYVDQCGPTPFSTAYGEAVPRSFGTLNTSLGPSFAAPQLAPGGMSAGTMSSGIQTGGARRRRRRVR